MAKSSQTELYDLQSYKKAYEDAYKKAYEEALKLFEEVHNNTYKHKKVNRRERDREYNKHRLPFFKPDGTRTKTVALSDDEKALLKPLSQWDRYEAYQTILAARTNAGQEDERVA